VALKSKAWDRYYAAELDAPHIVNCNRTTNGNAAGNEERYTLTPM